MILTFTDFGANGPYRGQMHAVLAKGAPGHAIIDLMVDAPSFDPKASSYLLAALLAPLPEGAVVVAVVDPDVGGARLPMIVRAHGHWIVGPDNGLMEIAHRQSGAGSWRIDWRPPSLSATFHGRDLFAPVAATLAMGALPDDMECTPHNLASFSDWPDDLPEIVYVDAYGNAMTGWRAQSADAEWGIDIMGRMIHHAPRFGAVARGQPFWYVNSSGLVEIAMNGESAALRLGLGVGSRFTWRECHETINAGWPTD
jgi:S-adenosylmethionine hydrolase